MKVLKKLNCGGWVLEADIKCWKLIAIIVQTVGTMLCLPRYWVVPWYCLIGWFLSRLIGRLNGSSCYQEKDLLRLRRWGWASHDVVCPASWCLHYWSWLYVAISLDRSLTLAVSCCAREVMFLDLYSITLRLSCEASFADCNDFWVGDFPRQTTSRKFGVL